MRICFSVNLTYIFRKKRSHDFIDEWFLLCYGLGLIVSCRAQERNIEANLFQENLSKLSPNKIHRSDLRPAGDMPKSD